MNGVERHSVTGYGRQDINYNDPEGEFVYYEDYTALQQQLTATNNSLTNAQEALKSAGIEADTVQAGVMELVDKLRIKQNHIQLRDTYIEELEQRAEAAEAKLAELEKQDITGWRAVQNDKRDLGEPLYLDGLTSPVGWESDYAPVYSRPAPAINLNAVRAEGLDMAAAEVDRWIGCDLLAREIRLKTAQLRAGNAGKDGGHE